MMSMDLREYVRIYNNFLEIEDCKNVVKALKKCDWEKHQWYSANYDSQKPGDNSHHDDLFVCGNADFGEDAFINKQLWTLIHQYILEDFKHFDWFGAWNGYTKVRYNWYKKGTRMRNHCDHIYSVFDGNRKGVPILTILGALNDNYEGGELVLWNNDVVPLKAGQVMVFPSNFLYPHKVEPVKKGSRYSFVSWVW